MISNLKSVDSCEKVTNLKFGNIAKSKKGSAAMYLHLEVPDPLELLSLRLLEGCEEVVHRLLPLLQLAVLLVPLRLVLLNHLGSFIQ